MSRSGRNGRDDELPAESSEAARSPDAAAPERRPPTRAWRRSQPAREDVDALRRERDELKDALLRRRAEFENYRKRVERDQGVAAVDAAADVLRRLVGTVDNLERALAAGGGEEALRQGVELTLRDLQAALEAQGVVVARPARPALRSGAAPGAAARARAGLRGRGRSLRCFARGTRTRTACCGRRS